MNDTFYPTPAALAREIADRIDPNARFILDPSAGAGAFLDAVRERFHMAGDHSSFGYHEHRALYAIESDQELVATLRGKGYNVIAYDFLTYEPANYFDAIIMNPPFANGDAHLLHALEIMTAGEIVCLLNRETLANPYTKTRQLLASKLKDLGAEITDLGQAFARARRPTDVEVVMIYLRKEATQEEGFSYWSEMSKEPGEKGPEAIGGELTQHDQVEALVSSYNEVQRQVREGFTHIQRALHYAYGIMEYFEQNVEINESINCLSRLTEPRSAYYRAVNLFADSFRRAAWREVFRRTHADRLMSREVYKRFQDDLDRGSGVQFTVENIWEVVSNLFQDLPNIVRQSIVDVFEHLCKFAPENRVHIEGWKSNSFYKVNRKVIVPWVLSYDPKWRHWENRLSYYDGGQVMNDLDKVLCHLSGRNPESTLFITQALETTFRRLNNSRELTTQADQSVFSTHFELRFFKKGSLHLRFLDERLWARFNIEAARGKNWIGQDPSEEKEYGEHIA